MKRIARGFRNFEFVRQRFLFATRKKAAILGAPRKLEETYLKNYIPHSKDDEYFYDEDTEDDWTAIEDE